MVNPNLNFGKGEEDKNEVSLVCPLEFARKPCVSPLTDTNSNLQVLLLGDSHAWGLSKVLSVVSAENKATLHINTAPACSFVLKFSLSADSQSEYRDKCLMHNKKSLGWLKDRNIQLVVVAARSSSLIPQQYSGNRSAYLKDYAESIKELTMFVDRVYVILPNPEFVAHTIWQASKSQEMSFMRKEPLYDLSDLPELIDSKKIYFIDSIGKILFEG